MNQYFELYPRLVLVLTLNVPLVLGILLLDMRGANMTLRGTIYFTSVVLGYYMFPFLILASVLFTLLLPAKQLLTWLICVVCVTFTYFLLLDSFVYGICKLHIDFFWLEFILRDYRALGLPFTTPLLALGALAIIIVFELITISVARRVRPSRSAVFLLIALGCFSLGYSQIVHIVAYDRNDAIITSLSPRFPFYLPFTSHSNADKLGQLFPFDEFDTSSPEMNEGSTIFTFPLSEMRFSPEASKNAPNILMILLESWRSDAMDEVVTPNINAFAENSIVFRNHYSSGNSTTCGIFGLFYGIDPTYWAAVKANSSLINNPPLIDTLTDRGYTFGIFANSNFDRHKIKDTIFRGIQVHENFEGKSIDQNDRDMTVRTKEFIREQSTSGNPFFAFTFFKSSHNSYHYPKEHNIFQPSKNLNMAFIKENNRDFYKNDYLNAVHYNDALVAELLAELEELGELDNTIILITSDHGESFNDNHANYWGHGSNFTHFQVQVPLIIRYPEYPPRNILKQTSHIDISPTLLQNTFGCITKISDYSNGQNLLGTLDKPRPFVIGSYVNHAFIFDQNVFEIYPTYTKKYKLHDINLGVSQPHPVLVKQVMEEINRFFRTGKNTNGNS